MATDDSISEDVSGSVALSQDHAENSVGKDSEGSVDSEDALSGPTASEEGRISAQSAQTLEGILTAAAGTVTNKGPITPASNSAQKNRNLHLDVKGSGRSLTTIIPSPLETLTALVQEIQNSGGTDPEIWRDCEGRWLQLFELVEKQYRDQILAQHEQYQRQVQLIQDEIKALVRLQNRSRATQNPDGPLGRGAGDSPLVRLLGGGLAGPPLVPRPPSATSPVRPVAGQPRPKARDSREEGAMTVNSSGYGTLSTWGGPSPHWGGEGGGQSSVLGLRPAATPDSDLMSRESQRKLPNHTSLSASPANHSPSAAQHKATSQLTSWAQKRRVPRSRSAQSQRPRAEEEEGEEEEEESRGGSLSADGDRPDEYRTTCLKRTDSLMSEASGLTYWRLDEGELYRPLPDSFDSGAYLLLQDMSLNQDDPKLPGSLREIYQRRQGGRAKQQEWDSSLTSNASTPQVLTLDPTLHMKQSDRTSGFTSPSHFSSPSSPQQPPPGHAPGAPALSPDSMSEGPPARGSPRLSPAGTPTEGGPNGTAAAPAPPHALYNRVPYGDDESSRRTVLTPHAHTRPDQSGGSLERTASSSSLEDPVVMSLVRQSLKEKHSRHVADLRAYYESEISSLKEQLSAELRRSDADLQTSNRALLERCEHLDRALTEASACIRDLENKNRRLESQLAEWPGRYAAADAAVQALRARLEDSDRGGREKDGALARLRSRLQELQRELDGASRLSHDQGAQMRQEHRALQELLVEYDSLRKDHDRVKDDLASAENKLFDANSQISELKRFVSKLESQVKQLEHENLAKTRHMIQARSQAGLSQQPDLLLSPCKSRALLNSDRKWPSPEPDPSAHSGPASDRTATHTSRCYSPPPETPTPLMKALLRMEEARGSRGHAPPGAGSGSPRPTVSFVEGSRGASLQRSLSPEGPRSSSLPPGTRRSAPTSTPTKRETLITPLPAKSSPKRCPTENYSTAFGRSPVQQLYSNGRLHVNSDQTDPSSTSLSRTSSLRKRLQFSSEGPEGSSVVPCQPSSGGPVLSNGAGPGEQTAGLGREEQGAELPDASDSDVPSSYQPQVQSLADTERLFDELTQEKQQIEAELSRIPGGGARVTMQSRLDEVALERRLEKVNRDLGSIRMTLKRFHVLRSSANI
ncbi:M-phase phosphoprotein 9 [Anguilla anguilla]|uniref:M-phase phosphoprotein 9 n=1 Tax=Anguilla anguilla TaxID=7936 RepID=UPI0015B0BB4D|nr:M-phase phosphoprotein 9 [Anguilla anguilla]